MCLHKIKVENAIIQNVVIGLVTTMTRIWRTKDPLGNNILPEAEIQIEQNGNKVVITKRHLEIALAKWFGNPNRDQGEYL